MDCPECGTDVIPFSVPAVAREAVPGDAAAICPTCLTLLEAGTADPGADSDPDFSRIVESFPEGEPGAVMAVATGLLVESLALNRNAVTELMGWLQGTGVDPWLVLERLAASPTVRSDADLGRARRQLEQFLDG